MIIEKVKLKNFMIHEDFECRFTEGINVIVGDNGTGKSSIVEAIGVALYGFPGRRYRNKREYVNEKSGSKSFEVEVASKEPALHINLTDRKHVLTDGNIRVDTNIASAVGKHLGMDKSTFMNTAYCAQGEITKLVDGTPRERERELLKVLGLDEIRKVIRNLESMYSMLRSEVERLPSPEGVKVEIKNKLRELEQARKDREVAEKRAVELKKTVEDLEKRLEECNELSRLHAELLAKRRLMQGLSEDVRAFELLKRLKGVPSKEEAERLEGEVIKLEKRIEELTERMEEIKGKASEIKLKLNHAQELEKKLSQLDEKSLMNELKCVDDELKKLEDRLSDCRGKLLVYEKRARELSSFEGGQCPTCGSELSRERAIELLDEAREQVMVLSREIKALENRRKELRRRREKLQAKLFEFEDAQKKLKELGTSEELTKKGLELKGEYSELKRERNELSLQKKQLESKLKELAEEIARYENLKKNYESYKRLEKEVKELEARVRHYSEEEHRELKEKLSGARKQHEEANGTANALRERENSLAREVENLLEKYENVRDMRRKLETVKKLKKALDDYMKQYAAAVFERLPSRVNRIIGLFGFAYRFDIDNDFSMKIITPSGQKRDIGYLSEGQRVVLGLALRIALAGIVSGGLSPILILDEPTHGLSRAKIERLAEFLRRLADSRVVKQIIVVTHEQRLEEIADNVVRLGVRSHSPTPSVEDRMSREVRNAKAV